MLPLRVHAFLMDVPLHDVWAVDLPRLPESITLDEFYRRTNMHRCCGELPVSAGVLMRLRLFVGRLFRLEAKPKQAIPASFAARLTPQDRARSSVEAGTPDGLFRVVYRFENEQLLEVQNRTAHAAALSALAQTAGGYRFYLAVYVERVSWITPVYMAFIDPFRKWIVYPGLLKTIRETWSEVG